MNTPETGQHRLARQAAPYRDGARPGAPVAVGPQAAGRFLTSPPCLSFMTGLDDGPWLPGCGPRKRRKPKTAAENRAARAKAWATRRQKLGPKGHR